MKKEAKALICPRCRQVVDESDLLVDGVCEECISERERRQMMKERLFRNPPLASERNILEKL